MKMKGIGALPLPSWRWLICALALGAVVAVSAPALAQTIIAKQYDFYPDNVSVITFDSDNHMWAKPSTAAVISLDPASNVLTTWTHSNPFGVPARSRSSALLNRPRERPSRCCHSS